MPADVDSKAAYLQDRRDQHRRLRPAHNPWPHYRAGRAGPRARDHGRGHRDGPGRGVHQKGDLVSVPFNIACGRCRMCKEGNTGVCLNVNPSGYGSAYGYVDMGGWVGGQAKHVMTPLRRLEPAPLPRQGASAGEDPRPHDAVGHLPHRLPRLRVSRRDHRLHRLHRGRGGGRPSGRACRAAARGGRRDRRRHEQLVEPKRRERLACALESLYAHAQRASSTSIVRCRAARSPRPARGSWHWRNDCRDPRPIYAGVQP
jgi:hypothetical protein